MFPWGLAHLEFFHKYHPASYIFVIIHVDKTFRAIICEMSGKYLKKKTGNHKTLFKSINFFAFPVKVIKISGIFYKIKKFI